jgi:hypothetical protein
MKSSQLRLFADDSIICKTIKSQKDCDIFSKKTLMLPQDGKVTG